MKTTSVYFKWRVIFCIQFTDLVVLKLQGLIPYTSYFIVMFHV